MRMNRGTIALVVVGIIVIIGVLVINYNQANTPDATPTASQIAGGPLFLGVTADMLVRFEVRDNTTGARTVLARSGEDLWELEETGAPVVTNEPTDEATVEATEAASATSEATAEGTPEATTDLEPLATATLAPLPEPLVVLQGTRLIQTIPKTQIDQLIAFITTPPYFIPTPVPTLPIPLPEITVEATEQATPEATEQATEEATEQATPEATIEATAEATPES